VAEEKQTHPYRDHPNTYVVQDRSSQDEMQRLRIQDQIMTAGMGGVLSEQPDASRFESVLDVGCGTGGWLIEVAKTYPTAKRLVGVDASGKMLDYAREQAQIQQVSERVEFLAMDALLMLEFPVYSFDLVNHRFAGSWLRIWDWPKLLSEYRRVLRPGGVIRVSESDFCRESGYAAYDRINQLYLAAFFQGGYLFTPEPDGMIGHLARLLQQHGVQDVQTRSHIVEFRAGTPEGHHFAEDMRLGCRTVLPFLRKWTRVPDDYESLYQQVLQEMQEPNFVASWEVLTAWGTNPDCEESNDFLQVR